MLSQQTEQIIAERELPLRWHYLSFAGEVFLGAVIIRCHGVIDGVMLAHALHINPGGEVMCILLLDERLPPECYRHKLLTKKEVLTIWPDAKHVRELEQEDRDALGI